MRPRFVLLILSFLLLVICGFMLVPMGIALYLKEWAALKAFLIPMLITAALCGGVLYGFRNIPRKGLNSKAGFLLVSSSWVAASLLGCLPFYLSGHIPSIADAFFETMSGFTTTGASILTDIEALPQSLLFWRSLTHWLGGMGIVVLTVAVLPLLDIGGLQLIKAEAPGPTMDKITPRITETAKILWLVYIGYTVAETLLLMFGGMSLFDALTHTFGTLATGGFSPKAASVGHYDSAYIDAVITLFMVLAGMNFVLHFKLLTGRFKEALGDTELKAYFLIYGISVILITVSLLGTVSNSIAQCLRYSTFQAATVITTTGYATADFEAWPAVAKAVLFILMFVGGCSGSTGGGIKVIRFVALFKEAMTEMKKLVHPRGIFAMKVGSQPLHYRIVHAISGFFFLYIIMLLLTTLVAATAGVDLVTSVTTALVTVGNIGPGFGLIGPTDNFSFYPDYVKWFLSFAMMVGRLELYTVLVLFTPLFWRD